MRNRIPKIETNDEERRTKLVSYFVGLGISFVAASLICAAVICIQLYGNGEDPSKILYRALVDGFSISGILLVMFFFLVRLSDYGAFDILVYGVKLAFYNTFYKNIRDTKLPASYADYKELKRQKPKLSVSYMWHIGLLFLIIGIILLIPYYRLRP